MDMAGPRVEDVQFDASTFRASIFLLDSGHGILDEHLINSSID